MKNNVYDFIVFGATMPGIVFAIKKSFQGHSVLLTNNVGFPGGSITEQLNCLQEVNEITLDGMVKNIYQSISGENFERSIVNPESVKFALQKMLEQSNVELYFHAVPKHIDGIDHGLLEVSFLAKEGITKVRGKKIVDASDDYYGAILRNYKRTVVERRINLFISSPSDKNFLSYNKIRTAVNLPDGRYWLSLRIEAKDDLFVENETHALLDTFRVLLEESHSRIHVLPLGVQTLYTMDSVSRLDDGFTTIDDMLGSLFAPSEQFLKASAIATEHDKYQ